MVSIRLNDLGAGYGRKPVVSGISTPAFGAGEVIAVVGPNAAGKSTLFKRIAGLLKGPGEVILEVEANGWASGRAISYMPQDNSSSAVLSVYESIVLARKQGSSLHVGDHDLRVVDATVEALGIEAIVARNIGDLSGGQRQLVSIAQTLAREPQVLLMDEPTSALDLHRQIGVLSLVRRLARERGMVIFIALHDLNHALRFADHVMVIANGGLHACGPVAEVLTPALLRSVYEIEARIERCSQGQPHVIVDDVASGRPVASFALSA
ncbi:ABC transporter ATP-binding protein [Nitratireductor thuwali]|uniref:Fe(3+) dicitrate transport ATP-binding protein FecE n=1 Tax=Nitratireductor thuwali TaxID=2267699 RepID=A0ABY5MJJ0_9HYPH|nr:Fe(3+) dicitrate transport ATP-binding protein FecE [Nitratireductor thuwali]